MFPSQVHLLDLAPTAPSASLGRWAVYGGVVVEHFVLCWNDENACAYDAIGRNAESVVDTGAGTDGVAVADSGRLHTCEDEKRKNGQTERGGARRDEWTVDMRNSKKGRKGEEDEGGGCGWPSLPVARCQTRGNVKRDARQPISKRLSSPIRITSFRLALVSERDGQVREGWNRPVDDDGTFFDNAAGADDDGTGYSKYGCLRMNDGSWRRMSERSSEGRGKKKGRGRTRLHRW